MKSSIFYSITFTFFLSIVSVFMAYLWLMQYDQDNYTRELNTKYSIIARANLFFLNGIINHAELVNQTAAFRMQELEDDELKSEINLYARVLERIDADIGTSSILLYKKAHYLKISAKDTTIFLKDIEYQSYRYDIIRGIFGLILVLFLSVYIFIIRKLKPLRKLKFEIDKFAQGKLEEVSKQSVGNDEISQVADAFHDAVNQIKSLNNSRQLFLRNIMHELKTPITKGRITVEMIDNEKYKDRLIGVFQKLEVLINEFASIEQITSGIGLTNTADYRLVDLVDEALDIAMCDNESIKVNIMSDLSLRVDFKLFSIALKNMIDNAIKYSPNGTMKIVADSSSIRFVNKGEPLEHDLSHFTEPFTQGKNSKKSFGLGLYLVQNITKAHNLKLNYKYKNGYNIFIFENLKEVSV